jgi:S-adenosylmethionine:tRNA ribosyltransferase-isomerase
MRVADFDYELPEELIAQEPLPERDESRLLVLRLGEPGAPPEHRAFRELPDLLAPGDLLVVNDARVVPARIEGRKRGTGGRVDVLVVAPAAGTLNIWRCIAQAAKPIRVGAEIEFTEDLTARVAAAEGEGFYRFEFRGNLESALERSGQVPLPPYIRRAPRDADRERYQTVFARTPGAVAAPTAGLHFTPRVLDALAARRVGLARVTLFVGPGTFLPVRVDEVERHRMHRERYEVPPEASRACAETRRAERRVVAVGTTALRTLEAAWDEAAGAPRAGPGETDLFVYPGYRFRAVDALLTNFHLPRSTLLMLVCAFGGRERVLAAYREAVASGYRFFSYGDAMLLL